MQPLDALQQIFGHSEFRATQSQIIDRVLSDQHALVIMPTGMGKSLCYQIPAVVDWPNRPANENDLVLVLSPLIALMKDQVDALVRKGVDAAFINSSLNRDERTRRYDGVAKGKYTAVRDARAISQARVFGCVDQSFDPFVGRGRGSLHQ